MSYTTVIFDIDGTLIDSESAVLYTLQNAVLSVTGKKYEYPELYFALGIPSSQALRMLAGDRWPEAARLGMRLFQEASASIPLFPGIEDTVKYLHKKGTHLGIVTSKMRAEFERTFLSYSISPYFSHAVCADDMSHHKPHPAPLLKCIEILNASPKQSLYIGDSKYDMECAANADVDFALALWGCREPEHFPVKQKLSSPEDLLVLC